LWFNSERLQAGQIDQILFNFYLIRLSAKFTPKHNELPELFAWNLYLSWEYFEKISVIEKLF